MGGGSGGGGDLFSQVMQYKNYQLAEKQLKLSEKQLAQQKLSVLEPVKSSENAMTGAADSTVKAAQLRRGIASAFNRPTAFTPVGGGATGGTSAKLGD